LMKLDYIDAVITNVPVNPLVWGIRFDSTTDNKLVELAMKISEDGTRYLCSLPQKYGKPVVCVRWHRSAQKDTFEDMLVESGVPVYDTPEQCARAMYALAKYAEIKNRA
jgi:acyl-CoA synthetase (NDP forming)